MLAPEARQTLVPDGRQQLLYAGMGHKGFLLVLDRKLETLQGLEVTGLPGVAVRVVVQHHLQLIGGPDYIGKLHVIFSFKKSNMYQMIVILTFCKSIMAECPHIPSLVHKTADKLLDLAA